MLVLMRRVGEVLCVGNDIRFIVLGIKGNQVRIGVQAPRNVSVDREEIYLRKQNDRRPAADGSNANSRPELLRQPSLLLKR